MEELRRSFGGMISNDIKDYGGNKALMRSEKRHLRAYLKGRRWFTNGTKNADGMLIPFAVQEEWK